MGYVHQWKLHGDCDIKREIIASFPDIY